MAIQNLSVIFICNDDSLLCLAFCKAHNDKKCILVFSLKNFKAFKTLKFRCFFLKKRGLNLVNFCFIVRQNLHSLCVFLYRKVAL